MAWTYSDSPASVPRDAVRLLIGDTSSADQQPVSDNEIAYFLSQRNNVVELAAADAAGKLAAYYSRQADTTNSKLSVSASQRAAAFRLLVDELQAKARALNPPTNLSAGGLSISAKQSAWQDTDAVQPAFSLGMHDEPGVSSSDEPLFPPGT